MMTERTSPAANIILSETASRELSPNTRAYFAARLRSRLYDLVMGKFREEAQKNDLTRAALGRRIGKRPEVITRLMSAPGNWTLETVSDLLMGISGEELIGTTASPLAAPAQNRGYQDVMEGASQDARERVFHALDSPENRGADLAAQFIRHPSPPPQETQRQPWSS